MVFVDHIEICRPVYFLVKQLIYRTVIVQLHTFNLLSLVAGTCILISFLNVWRFKLHKDGATNFPPPPPKFPVFLHLLLISSSFVQPNFFVL